MVRCVRFHSTQTTAGLSNLYSKGCGVFGSLGHGDSLQDHASFQLVQLPPEVKPIVRVSAGWGHSAAITTDAKLLIFGRPYDFSNLLQINRLHSVSPGLGRFVGRFTRFFGAGNSGNKSSGSSTSGADAGLYTTPTVFDIDNVANVTCSAGLTAALTLDGRVYCFGLNRWGQCGAPADKMGAMHVYKPKLIALSGRILMFDVGLQHCLAANHLGQVFAWGKGNRGQLGDGNNDTSAKPVKVKLPSTPVAFVIGVSAGFNHSAALTSDGSVYVWGKGMSAEPKEGQRKSLSGLVQVYLDQNVPRLLTLPGDLKVKEIVSSNFTLVLRALDDSLWAMGLGEDDRNCIPSPIPVQQATMATSDMPSSNIVSSPQVILGPTATLRKGYKRVVLFDKDIDGVSSSPNVAGAETKPVSTVWSTYNDPKERVFEVVLHDGEAFLHPMDDMMEEGKAAMHTKKILDVSPGWRHTIGVFE